MSDGGPSTSRADDAGAFLQLLDRQQEAWRRGEPILVEDLIREAPAIAAGSEALLDLIYGEVRDGRWVEGVPRSPAVNGGALGKSPLEAGCRTTQPGDVPFRGWRSSSARFTGLASLAPAVHGGAATAPGIHIPAITQLRQEPASGDRR